MNDEPAARFDRATGFLIANPLSRKDERPFVIPQFTIQRRLVQLVSTLAKFGRASQLCTAVLLINFYIKGS
jgi:hypothetical protein